MTENIKLTKKDFASSQDVRWCPGCGDYAILSSVQMAMAQLGLAKEKVAVISGIGCSSRFPYYMGTYGMHSIHGRAPAFATGLKVHNPDLSVWLVTGDGDGLSIGGNHLAHIVRRNVDVNLMLFNNEIYGLTKGQYSPTSKEGIKTKSTPYGSLDRSFSPMKFAMGAGATFFARTIDTDPKHMIDTFKKAHAHKGTSFIEIFQNCVIFNDKVHDSYTNRKTRDEAAIFAEEGKPLIFGKEKDKAIVLDGLKLKVVNVSDVSLDEILVHDSSNEMLAHLYSTMNSEDFPMPIGVLHKVEGARVYEEQVCQQIKEVQKSEGVQKMQTLLNSGATWEVK